LLKYYDVNPKGVPTESFSGGFVPDGEEIDERTTDPPFDLASWIANLMSDVRAPNRFPHNQGSWLVE
jgi:hypothetical protein